MSGSKFSKNLPGMNKFPSASDVNKQREEAKIKETVAKETVVKESDTEAKEEKTIAASEVAGEVMELPKAELVREDDAAPTPSVQKVTNKGGTKASASKKESEKREPSSRKPVAAKRGRKKEYTEEMFAVTIKMPVSIHTKSSAKAKSSRLQYNRFMIQLLTKQKEKVDAMNRKEKSEYYDECNKKIETLIAKHESEKTHVTSLKLPKSIIDFCEDCRWEINTSRQCYLILIASEA